MTSPSLLNTGLKGAFYTVRLPAAQVYTDIQVIPGRGSVWVDCRQKILAGGALSVEFDILIGYVRCRSISMLATISSSVLGKIQGRIGAA